MKILYVAKHNSGGADDEGAVSHALIVLGHTVHKVSEKIGDTACRVKADLCLFHHWPDVDSIRKISIPKAFWNFDLVEWPDDPTLDRRSDARRRWMMDVMPLVDIGFCTDGDWTAKFPDKLVWLTQGADERVVGRGTPRLPTIPILFTGISRGGGVRRESFVNELMDRYRERFVNVQRGCYRRNLADLIASASVVVAPDSPVTDRYWSNRVYNTLGFGALLIHPYSAGLRGHYGLDEVYMYEDRQELHRFIDWAIANKSGVCEEFRIRSLETTKARHLYRHRCEVLINIVKERIL